MSSVTVAHVVLGLQIGGLERVVVNLVRGLQTGRFRPLVVCLEEGGPFVADLESAGIPVHILGKRPGRDWDAIRRLARFFKQESVQIVHTHNPTPHFHGIAAAVLAGVPIRVHTKHGRNYPDDKRKVFINRVLSWLTDVIVPVSDNSGAVALSLEKINPVKIRRIWNGVDPELYRPQTVGQRPPTIGTVARLSPDKDQMTMLAAFKLVLDQWNQTAGGSQRSALSPQLSLPDHRPQTPDSGLRTQDCGLPSLQPSALPRLVIVGDGPCMADLRNEANRLGIASQVDFLGARNDIATLLSGMDVFTLSSITEGISMTILEAMACGVPIVASDVGGNREIVQPPQCGLIVPARDPQALAAAYLELLRNPAQRVQMGAAGRQRVIAHFSLPAMVRQYSELYDELLKRKTA